MALRVPRQSSIQKESTKMASGLDEAVFKNIEACCDLAEITRTSLGPNGKSKLIINHLEKLFLTNDANTILSELDIVHPAAKLILLAANQQHAEFGDMSNLILVLSGDLLNNALVLLQLGLLPASIIDGYALAHKLMVPIMDSLVIDSINLKDLANSLEKIVNPVVSSKQYGYQSLLTPIIVQACMDIMPKNPHNFNVDSVRIVKILGASLQDSHVVKGMVFGREAEGAIKNVSDAKIAIFSCALDVQTTETKGTVLIKNAQEMLQFSSGEEVQLEALITSIADTGVKVVVGGSGIGELAMHYFNRCGIMVVKILSKFDLRRLCRVTGATVLTRMGPPLAEELGHVDIVESIEVGSDRCTVFRQMSDATRTSTIVIRGSTMNLLDDMERAIDDAVNTVKQIVSKDQRLLAGAGAVELEISRLLSKVGEQTPGLAQYSIKAFAKSFESVARTLAENAGMDSTEVLSRMYAAHESGNVSHGVDIESEEDGIVDSRSAGILDCLVTKQHAVKLAVDAVNTILSIDQIIMSRPAGGPKPPKQENWDED